MAPASAGGVANAGCGGDGGIGSGNGGGVGGGYGGSVAGGSPRGRQTADGWLLDGLVSRGG